jgi:predicted NodU family carbamoyl transferase
MKIYGISYVGHDHGITIVENNEIKIVYELERINRIKRNMEFFSLDLIDVMKNFSGNSRTHGFFSKLKASKTDFLSFCNAKIMPHPFFDSEQQGYVWNKLTDHVDVEWMGNKYHYTDHHIVHGTYAYCTSPFDECDIFVYDGMGNQFNTILFDNSFSLIDFKCRIGMTWMNSSTQLLGRSGMLQAGTLMAAASYGKRNNTLTELFYNDFSNANNKLFEMFQLAKNNEKMYFDMCAALQKATEIKVIELLKKSKTSDNLCISGGVGLNGYVNQKILDSKLYNKVYTPPACSDAGLSTGIALHANWTRFGNKKPINYSNVAYLGREFDVNEELIRRLIHED